MGRGYLGMRVAGAWRRSERMPWIGVTSRFSRFDSDLQPTTTQIEDADTKQLNVRKCLQAAYYGIETDEPPGFLVGSWAKRTPVRPSGDIDLLFPIPASDWSRINTYAGNSQSTLLQEVKGILAQRYSSTDLRGDGQVVQVKFNSIMVEVVPAFSVGDGYEYAMPNTHNGGWWQSIWPTFERVIRICKIVSGRFLISLSLKAKRWLFGTFPRP